MNKVSTFTMEFLSLFDVFSEMVEKKSIQQCVLIFALKTNYDEKRVF